MVGLAVWSGRKVAGGHRRQVLQQGSKPREIVHS